MIQLQEHELESQVMAIEQEMYQQAMDELISPDAVRNDSKDRRLARHRAGLCWCGGLPVAGGTTCQKCRDRRKEIADSRREERNRYLRERRQRRIEQQLCVNCPKPSPNHAACDRCRKISKLKLGRRASQ